MAESTERVSRRTRYVEGFYAPGKFPPTPKDQSAAKQPIAAKFGLLPAIIPNTAVIPSVRLNAHFLPKMSQPNPQNIAPQSNPMFCARVRRGGRPGLNSFVIGVKIRDVTIGQRLSEAHPKPTTMKSCHWYHPIPIS